MASQRLVLIRHGETAWSKSGQHTGSTDVPLLDEGRAAARRVRPVLAGRDFALVLSSPLERARETCELAGLGERAVVEPDLVEWDYGDEEGLTTDEIRVHRPGWDVWQHDVGRGEPLPAVAARVDRVIARALDARGDVALVAHGHILRVLTARWIELDPATAGSLPLGTAALCELGFERERRAIWRWNDTHHVAG